jgi:Flp pilus assembly protein TadG
MRIERRVLRSFSQDNGQSLIEAAILIPLLLVLTFNAINFGNFCVVALNLSSAAREGAQYSASGFSSNVSAREPAAAAVNNQVIEDLTNALAGASGASVRVCSQQVGVNSTTNAATCQSYGTNSSWTSVAVDPEAPYFVLNQVDVNYTISPIIPTSIFNLQPLPSLTYTQHVYMRSMP